MYGRSPSPLSASWIVVSEEGEEIDSVENDQSRLPVWEDEEQTILTPVEDLSLHPEVLQNVVSMMRREWPGMGEEEEEEEEEESEKGEEETTTRAGNIVVMPEEEKTEKLSNNDDDGQMKKGYWWRCIIKYVKSSISTLQKLVYEVSHRLVATCQKHYQQQQGKTEKKLQEQEPKPTERLFLHTCTMFAALALFVLIKQSSFSLDSSATKGSLCNAREQSFIPYPYIM